MPLGYHLKLHLTNCWLLEKSQVPAAGGKAWGQPTQNLAEVLGLQQAQLRWEWGSDSALDLLLCFASPPLDPLLALLADTLYAASGGPPFVWDPLEDPLSCQ
mmetsp:Transcript_87665/g.173983  ORF Transcript_87665/g.173983 Transcript_87665/m.173983 type:complete len:102 (-) Transcript_87665:306-611(-)